MRDFRWGWTAASAICLAVLAMQAAQAQPRTGSSPSSQRVGPALPSTGHQDEAIDLNEGKTPAQIFASDCAVCHQKPGELAGGRDAGQLATFLRQHYTTGIAQARILAAYVASLSSGRGQAERRLPERPEVGDGGRGLIGTLPNFMGIGRKPAPAEEAAQESGTDKPREPAARTAKPADEAPAEAKPEEAKPADAKPEETKPADVKPADTKPADTKPADAKPADTKPADTKPAGTKPAEVKPAPGAEPGKPAATAGAKPAAKPKDGAAGEKPSAGPAQQKPPARGSDVRI